MRRAQVRIPDLEDNRLKTIRIGAGAGFAGDRIEPAVELAEKGRLNYLVFECLAERTIALAQQARLIDPNAGFDPLLIARLHAVLPACHSRGTKIITNMGAANPIAAANQAVEVARELGLHGVKIAAVSGDDVVELVRAGSFPLTDQAGTSLDLGDRIISANAYLGAAPIAEALNNRADVVITGRVGDPALFAAPMIHEFGWSADEWEKLGKATAIGHLLECAGQVTGGYFVDPGYKSAPNLARLGFPLAIVDECGDAVITKVEGSGGHVSVMTCKEQLLYELHDPSCYYQPDVIADFSNVTFADDGYDRVAVRGARGRPPTGSLKVTIGFRDGFVGEGEMSYVGPNALARARLALDIVRERLEIMNVKTTEMRWDMIGVDAVHRGAGVGMGPEPRDVRIRVAGRTECLSEAIRIGNEVETLWSNGPAGGGGGRKMAREIIATASILIDARQVDPSISYVVA